MGPIVKKDPTAGIAKPRCLGVQISASVPERIDEGAAPKNPCRNRRMKMVTGLEAVMTGSCTRVKLIKAASNGILLPKHSLSGLHSLISVGNRLDQTDSTHPQSAGPNAKPTINSEVHPNTIVSFESPNSSAIATVAVPKTDEANVVVSAYNANAIVISHFRI